MTRNPRFLDESGYRALLRAAKDRGTRTAIRDRVLFLLLARTGLRISEALTLTPRDIFLDSDTPTLAVLSLKKRTAGRGKDEVYLDRVVSRVLSRYLRKTLPRLLHRQLLDQDPIFPVLRGSRRWTSPAPAKRMSRRNAHQLFTYYARRAGLAKGITLHSLRHYYATVLNEIGDLAFTCSQLRHSSLSSTQRYVGHFPARIKVYMDALSRRRKT